MCHLIFFYFYVLTMSLDKQYGSIDRIIVSEYVADAFYFFKENHKVLSFFFFPFNSTFFFFFAFCFLCFIFFLKFIGSS